MNLQTQEGLGTCEGFEALFAFRSHRLAMIPGLLVFCLGLVAQDLIRFYGLMGFEDDHIFGIPIVRVEVAGFVDAGKG